MNTNFGRVENRKMTYAPNALTVDGGVIINPSADEYRRNGWLPNEVNQPDRKEGYHVSASWWDSDGYKNFKVYEYEKDAPVIHRYSKIKLEGTVFKLGLLDKLDAFIDEQEITNEYGQKMKVRRLYNTATEFSDDNPYFTEFSQAAKAAIGVDDETFKKIMRESEIVGV